jgi:hypothetical protein
MEFSIIFGLIMVIIIINIIFVGTKPELYKIKQKLIIHLQTLNKPFNPIPLYKQPPWLLSRPFNEFMVNSSHNTYLSGNQNFDASSLDAITHALDLGARVIELDIWSQSAKPVVAHGIKILSIITTGVIDFTDCIDLIAQYPTRDPIILYLELNIKSTELKQVDKIIKQKLSHRLLDSNYKITNGKFQYKFCNEPIGALLDKIIIISGPNSNYPSELAHLIDGQFTTNTTNDWLLNISSFPNKFEMIKELNKSTHQIIRIYPSDLPNLISSKNFNPTKYWDLQCGLVALNFQTLDHNLIKNLYFFANSSFIHWTKIKSNQITI